MEPVPWPDGPRGLQKLASSFPWHLPGYGVLSLLTAPLPCRPLSSHTLCERQAFVFVALSDAHLMIVMMLMMMMLMSLRIPFGAGSARRGTLLRACAATLGANAFGEL